VFVKVLEAILVFGDYSVAEVVKDLIVFFLENTLFDVDLEKGNLV